MHDRVFDTVAAHIDEDSIANDPMLRSMLILAGANEAGSEDAEHDGILTAAEVASLDLRGTELVSLTACHTGQGALADGLGVAGLRAAFAAAGARSVISSLWEVPTAESTSMSEGFYRRWLEDNRPRHAAFRDAQLQTLRDTRDRFRRAHPWYWAGFVYAGDAGE